MVVKIAVAAESIWDRCGLGHFLASGLRWLAKTNPDWEFHVVARSQFVEFYDDGAGTNNVTFYPWDRTAAMEWLRQNVRVRGRERVMRLVGKHAPSIAWRAALGDLPSIWRTLPQCDVVWAPHFDLMSQQWPVLYHRVLCHLPVLFTIHDVQAALYPEDWPPHALANFRDGLAPFARRAARIVTHSRYQQDIIVEQIGVARSAITVVSAPPLLDERDLQPARDSREGDTLLQDQYGISLPYLFYPGSTGYSHKNHVRLLLAWARLKISMGDECPRLVCTSKGDYWPTLKALIDALDLTQHVVFTGSVPLEHLALLYQQAEMVIVPSLYEGGGSGPVSEGLLAGKPVLCSKIPPFEEQLSAYAITGVTLFDGYSVEAIAEAVKSAWHRRPLLHEQAKNDRACLVSRLPGLWKEWANTYSNALSSLVASGSNAVDHHE